MTYACLTWEYATDAQLLKLQRLQNRAYSALLETLTGAHRPRIARGFQNSLHVLHN
jgi:hypothetical protein